MAESIILTMVKALVKGKLGIGELSGKERFLLAQLGMPDRVPYPAEYPIKEYADLEKLSLPEEASGYLKMYLDMIRECQNRYTDMFTALTLDGPWDLAILLRGDKNLPIDMKIHKDYCETEDPERRKKSVSLETRISIQP